MTQEPTHQELPLVDEPVGQVELVLGASQPAASLRLPARESGVAVARQFAAGMGDVLELGEDVREDLKLAVTEACTNAVVHAYSNGAAGAVELEIRAAGAELEVLIRDRGRGIPPDLDEGSEDGYGLELMRAVCEGVRFDAVDGGGTEVRLTLRDPGHEARDPRGTVHSPVLRRVVAMMAASAGFTMDRLSDAVLVAETLAAGSGQHTTDGIVRVTVEDRGSDVTLRVGPLVEGGAEALLADSRLPAYGGVLEHLADEVAPSAGHLTVRLDPR